MKKIFFTITLSGLFAFTGNAFVLDTVAIHTATAHNEDDAMPVGQTQDASDEPFLNIVKINLSSLVVKTFSFQYERVITPKLSACFGLRLTPKGGLPFPGKINSLIQDENEDPETKQFIEDTRLGGWAITPELRYYFGKGYGKGFYAGLFGRYERFSLSSVYPFKDNNNVTTNIGFEGHYASTGIGLMIGSQFMLGSRVTLDWWILGPYYARPKIELEASGFSLSDDERNQLQENLNIDIDYGSFKTTTVVTNTTASLKVDGGGTPLLRGFGLCLGVRF